LTSTLFTTGSVIREVSSYDYQGKSDITSTFYPEDVYLTSTNVVTGESNWVKKFPSSSNERGISVAVDHHHRAFVFGYGDGSPSESIFEDIASGKASDFNINTPNVASRGEEMFVVATTAGGEFAGEAHFAASGNQYPSDIRIEGEFLYLR